MSRIQLKLMATLALLVFVVVLTSGLLAERGLRERELVRLEESLIAQAGLIADRLRDLPFTLEDSARLDEVADRAASAAEVRVTLIAPNGVVVGDSRVPHHLLQTIENHGDRPEVLAAKKGRVGRSERLSGTVGHRLLYVAIPRRSAEGSGTVRLAVELDRIDAAAGELRGELLTAAGVGLLASLLLSYLISWLTLRPVEELKEVVGAIADGKLDRRLRWMGRDELGQIARSINTMAEKMRDRLDRATAEKDQLHAVLSSMVEGVLVIEEGRVVLANPRARELLAVRGQVEGKTPLEVLRREELHSALKDLATNDKPLVRELTIPGSVERVLLMHAAPLPGAGGAVAVFHDVSEIRHLEQVRRDFIANASHELRTPLTSISGFAGTLLSTPVSPEESARYLEVIVRNAERLSNLIEDLLELSRIESRKVPLSSGEVELRPLCDTVAHDLSQRAKDAGLALRVEGDADIVAWADRGAVEQVVTNLIDNSLKYSDPGGEVLVEIWSERRRVRLRVKDSGIGIPLSDLGRIFERFYRVDKSRSRALGGTGLGLSIVKHLLQAMGGDIHVESTPDEGSSFTVSLPKPAEDSTNCGELPPR